MTNFAKDPAINKGMIFGAILGVIHIIFVIINNLLNWQRDLYAWLNRSLLISLTLCFTFAGYSTLQAKSGAKAGFTAGLVSMAIGIISLWVVTFLFMDVIAQNTYTIVDFQRSGSVGMNQFIIEDAMGASVVEFVMSLVFGAAFGWIGGWLGSRFSSQSPARAL